MGINHSVEIFRNPLRTDMSGCRRVMPDKMNNFTDLEITAKQFQDAIVLAYSENCPLTVMENNRNISWWTQDLTEKRREVHKLLNVANKSGNWTDYKRNLTDNNKALRQANRESWRRYCEEIKNSRMGKIP